MSRMKLFIEEQTLNALKNNEKLMVYGVSQIVVFGVP
jgi:hypothetical protein